MRRHRPALLLLLLVVGACRSPEAFETHPSETKRLDRAISIALARTADLRREHGKEYRLIGAEQMILDEKYVWRVTFKPLHLLPDDPATGIVGAGGEIFVNVDLGDETATVGFGE
jgi:hypothetical protein